MTSRILLSLRVSAFVISLATLAIVVPHTAAAQTENKTRQVLEIKISQFNIPTVNELSGLLTKNTDLTNADPAAIATVEIQPSIQSAAIQNEGLVVIDDKPKAPAADKISYNLPPKTVGDARVSMSAEAIRAYVGPKIAAGDWNTFMAVLQAENGTHECTRDNRGTNKNGSVDVGLAQINWNPAYHPPYSFEQLQDCTFNLDIAIKKYQSRGFQPWAVYNKGIYKQFLQ